MERRSGGEAFDHAASELESRRARLQHELAEVDARVRQLMMLDDVCPRCLGSGLVAVRGGLYGEWQDQLCSCQLAAGSERAGLPCPRFAPTRKGR